VCECDQNDALKLEVLRNFNDYIKNNDSLIVNTISMLGDLYKNADTERTYDVEKDMKNILTFFAQLDKRDSVMNNIIDNIDDYLKANPHKKGEEIEKIKNIRDGIVLRDVQLAVLLGTPAEINAAADRTLLNTDNLNAVYGQANLQVVLSAEQLQVFLSTGQLNFILLGQAVAGLPVAAGWVVMDQSVINAVQSVASQGAIGVYPLPGDIVRDMHNIGDVYSSSSNLQDVMNAVTSVGSYINSYGPVLSSDIIEPL
jgi:hypothetical protein